MAQLLGCLELKHEVLSEIPSDFMVEWCKLASPLSRDRDKWIPGPCGPMRDPVSEHKVDGSRGLTPHVDLWNPKGMHTCVHVHPLKFIHFATQKPISGL